MKPQEKLHLLHKVTSNIDDWSEDGFNWGKAYAAALCSSLAYDEIPEFELNDSERAKIIPCDSYQAQIARWQTTRSVARLKQPENEFSGATIVRNNLVAVALQLPQVIFVAFRGTTLSFSDFKADLDVRKARYSLGFGESVKLHRGFFEAVLEAYDEIIERIQEFRKTKSGSVPIYACGHSLGGAMAAIFHGRMNEDEYHPFSNRRRNRSGRSTACYTFGMPRYQDLSAKALLCQPFHTFNELDAIPTLPPKFLGYVDSPNEQCINAIPAVIPCLQKGDFAFRSVDGMSTILGVSDHRLERYIDRVGHLAKM